MITRSAPLSDALIGASDPAMPISASPATMVWISVAPVGMYSSETSSPYLVNNPASWATQTGSWVTLIATNGTRSRSRATGVPPAVGPAARWPAGRQDEPAEYQERFLAGVAREHRGSSSQPHS